MMGLRQRLREARSVGSSLDVDSLKALGVTDTPVKMTDFVEALANVQRSVSSEDLGKFDVWMKEFGAV